MPPVGAVPLSYPGTAVVTQIQVKVMLVNVEVLNVDTFTNRRCHNAIRNMRDENVANNRDDFKKEK